MKLEELKEEARKILAIEPKYRFCRSCPLAGRDRVRIGGRA